MPPPDERHCLPPLVKQALQVAAVSNWALAVLAIRAAKREVLIIFEISDFFINYRIKLGLSILRVLK